MFNARLDEAQARIKNDGRNINNLRHTDDTTLWQKTKKDLSYQVLNYTESYINIKEEWKMLA